MGHSWKGSALLARPHILRDHKDHKQRTFHQKLLPWTYHAGREGESRGAKPQTGGSSYVGHKGEPAPAPENRSQTARAGDCEVHHSWVGSSTRLHSPDGSRVGCDFPGDLQRNAIPLTAICACLAESQNSAGRSGRACAFRRTPQTWPRSKCKNTEAESGCPRAAQSSRPLSWAHSESHAVSWKETGHSALQARGPREPAAMPRNRPVYHRTAAGQPGGRTQAFRICSAALVASSLTLPRMAPSGSCLESVVIDPSTQQGPGLQWTLVLPLQGMNERAKKGATQGLEILCSRGHS